MTVVLLPVVAALFLWWFLTGAIFWLAMRAGGRANQVMAGATVALAIALAAIHGLRHETGEAAIYLSFLAGLGVWGWVEISFLLGHVTGPIRTPCPPGARGTERFALAVGTIVWHELAVLGLGAALIWITWGAENQIGTWTYVLLMGMRISAKLNLFLGVPYPPALPLPRHLAHLPSYFRRRPPTVLLPLAITASTALATLVAWRAADPSLDGYHVTAYALFWTLLVLGIIEHWFLLLPVQESVLWRWFSERAEGGRGIASDFCPESRSPAYLPGSSGDKTRPAGDGPAVQGPALKAQVQGG